MSEKRIQIIFYLKQVANKENSGKIGQREGEEMGRGGDLYLVFYLFIFFLPCSLFQRLSFYNVFLKEPFLKEPKRHFKV